MVKKLRGGRKGIQQGVTKHKIRSRAAGTGGTSNRGLLPGLFRENSSKLAKLEWRIIFAACRVYHLLPFTCLENGKFVPFSRKRDKILHYIAFCTILAVFTHSVSRTVIMLSTEGFSVKGALSLSMAWANFVGLGIGCVIWTRPKETMEALNVWHEMAPLIERLRGGESWHPFDNVVVATQCILTFNTVNSCATAFTLLSLVFSDIPNCWYPTLRGLGVIPDGVLTPMWWKLILAPLEWATYHAPVMATAVAGILIVMIVGIAGDYTRALRNIEVTDEESRRKLEHGYVVLEVFNCTIREYARWMAPPQHFAILCGVIIPGFVAIRYTELPITCYFFFPYSFVVILLVEFIFCYDVVLVERVTADVIGTVGSVDLPYMRGMTRRERVEMVKRARAMRSFRIPIGDFSDTSLSLFINIWDESLNQIVFLLSL